MQEEYDFVTLDNDEPVWSDAVVVDIEGDDMLLDAVVIDESLDGSDFITLADDTVMLSDDDMLDMSSLDFDIDNSDITIIS